MTKPFAPVRIARAMAVGLALVLSTLTGPALADSPAWAIVDNDSGPALAGSPGWAISSATLVDGPGQAYDLVGQVAAETPLSVQRCTRNWCQVITEDYLGWMSQANISFGQEPRGPLSGPKFEMDIGGPGVACLYTGTGFSGDRLCGTSGFVIRDLHLAGLDNVFASATIDGEVTVMVCREAYFHAYCEHIATDRADLGDLLTRRVSSIRIY